MFVNIQLKTKLIENRNDLSNNLSRMKKEEQAEISRGTREQNDNVSAKKNRFY